MIQSLSPSPPSRRANVLVALAVLISQGPSLGRHFVWDDVITLDTLRLRGLQNPFGPDTFNFFRPGKMALFELQYLLFGAQNPLPWQAITLIAALVASLLCLRILTKLIGPGAALAGALMVAVHPMHVEATGWISATNGTWMLCAMLGYFLLMLRMAETPPPPKTVAVGAVGLLITALLLKEEAVMAPVLAAVLLWLVGTLTRRVGIHLVAHLVVCAAFAALTHIISSAAGQRLEPLHYVSWLISLQAPGRIFAHMAAFYWPFGWLYYRELPMQISYYLIILVAGILGMLILVSSVWKNRHTPGPVVAGLLFASLALLPTSNLIPAGNYLWGVRYMIPASLGLAMAGGWIWVRLREQKPRWRGLLNSVAGAWFVAALLTTWWGHYNWRTTTTLMEKITTFSGNPDLLLVRGQELFKAGQYNESLTAADQTIEASQSRQGLWDNNRNQLSVLGLSSLVPETTQTLILKALTSRVFALKQLGRDSEAWQAVQEGIALSPDYAPLLLHVADHFHEKYKISRSQADLSEAERNYQKAAQSTPETAETAWANLGLLYVDAGRVDLAIKVWQQGLGLMPGSATMRHNLGIALKNNAAKTSGTITTPSQP